MKKILYNLGIIIFIHLFFVSIWTNSYFGKVSGDEILFHALVPLSGVNKECLISYLTIAVVPTIITLALFYLFVFRKIKKKAILLLVLVIFSLGFAIARLEIYSYIGNQIKHSEFIEENYVDTNKVKIEFPKKRKNLIFIFLESMEITYADKKNGGAMSTNLLPNLTRLALENVSYSNTSKLGGTLGIEGSAWTVASIVSHTTGLPLKINFSSNGIIDLTDFMPGATSLGDILKDNGYDNYFLAGSDTNYGGRKAYFSSHGNYKIYDVNDALKDKKITEKVWWGFDDEHLFNIAKEQLLEISKNEKPFNYTMLTADTHFEDGYLEDSCPTEFNDHYSNVIYCNDMMLGEFIEWIKKQDFYEDTTIVLVGDHKSMDTDYFNKIDKDYIRTSYNVFINSSLPLDGLSNREFSAMDLFPTTLASIGCQIEGNRMGLGVNLSSREKTLIEEYGYKYTYEQLRMRSSFYNNSFLSYR